jgi:NUMOD3 motif
MTLYLYIKTHNKTGLKYLGQTSQKDPHKYPGSGTRWLHHLRKHGYDYSTKILKECSNKNELKEWGLYYSNLWNIVKDQSWANLKPEEADGGQQSEETKRKIGLASKGRKQSIEALKTNSEKNSGRNNPMFGKTHTLEAREKISLARKSRSSPTKGKVMSAEQKEKIRQSVKAQRALKKSLALN